MRFIVATLILLLAFTCHTRAQDEDLAKNRGVLLEHLSWDKAEKALTPNTVVVIPLGGAAKEHGYHLSLDADFLQAEYFKSQVLRRADVVIAPTINYHFYPAFEEYPGSTSLRLETARDLVVDICKSLARYGPHRFYVVDIGLSTLQALKPAADLLAKNGITLRYTDFEKTLEPIKKKIARQEGGSHADEVETSILLYISAKSVDMKKAVKDYRERKRFPTRDPKNTVGTYLPSGVYGDATLASREKGKQFAVVLTEGILRDIEELRHAPLPEKAQNR